MNLQNAKPKSRLPARKSFFSGHYFMSMETYDKKITQNKIYEQIMLAEEEVKNGAKPIPARKVFAALIKKYMSAPPTKQ